MTTADGMTVTRALDSRLADALRDWSDADLATLYAITTAAGLTTGRALFIDGGRIRFTVHVPLEVVTDADLAVTVLA